MALFFVSENKMNEIDLVVQRRQKPDSTEIETNLMQPNEAYWRFAAEIQPSDLKSCCFEEGEIFEIASLLTCLSA